MSSKNKEIELKIKISDLQFKLLQKWLKKNAKYTGEEHQIDTYFDHPKLKMVYKGDRGFIDARDYFRIRVEDNQKNHGKKVTTCLKHFYDDPENPGNYSHCDEFETKVEDAKILMKLYKALDFVETCVVDKLRKSYKYKDFEIEIDSVKDLGIFVEIELEIDVDDPQKGKAMIYALLKEIGINKFILTFRGYVSMIWNPGMDFGEEMVL